MKKLIAINLLAALQLAAQVEIHYSRQSDPIVKAIIGTVPKGISVYRADVVNVGTAESRIFPSRVGFEASAVAPMQDPAAAEFAAQHYKDTRWWVVALKFTGEAAKYAGPAALLLSTSGVALPAVVSGIAGGVGGTSSLLNSMSKDAAKLAVPATWLRDGMPEIVLRPGEPVPYLLALGGTPPETFVRVVGTGIENSPNLFRPLTPPPDPNPVPGLGVLRNDTGEVDVLATIMAARQAQAEATLRAMR